MIRPRKRVSIKSATANRRHVRQLIRRNVLTAQEKATVKHIGWTTAREYGRLSTLSGRVMIVEFLDGTQAVAPAERTLAVWDENKKEYFHSTEATIPYVELED